MADPPPLIHWLLLSKGLLSLVYLFRVQDPGEKSVNNWDDNCEHKKLHSNDDHRIDRLAKVESQFWEYPPCDFDRHIHVQRHNDQRIPSEISQHSASSEKLLANQQNHDGIGDRCREVNIGIAHSMRRQIGYGEMLRMKLIQHNDCNRKRHTDQQQQIFPGFVHISKYRKQHGACIKKNNRYRNPEQI